MKKPFLAEHGTSVLVSPEAIFDAVEALNAAGLKQQVVDALKEKHVRLEVPADIVNVVKNALFDKGAHRTFALAAAVVSSERCPSPAD